MKYADKLSYEQLCELFEKLKSKLVEFCEDENVKFYISSPDNNAIKNFVPYANQKYASENCLFLKQKDSDFGKNVFEVLSVHDMSFNFANIKLNLQHDELDDIEDVYIKFMLKTFGERWKQDFISYKLQQEIEHAGFYIKALKRSITEFCNNSKDNFLEEQDQLCSIIESLHSNDFDNRFVSKKVKDIYLRNVTNRIESLENELDGEPDRN